MVYEAECDISDCDESGYIVQESESIRTGNHMHRELTWEFQTAMRAIDKSETEEEEKEADKRLQNTKKWNHYCGKHAREIGII